MREVVIQAVKHTHAHAHTHIESIDSFNLCSLTYMGIIVYSGQNMI